MKKYIYILIAAITITSCKTEVKKQNGTLQIVTTTTMITDMVKNIGGDVVEVQGLMGSGVDPHLYKASAGDVDKLFEADVIIYNGLHLEGKLEDVFEKMRQQQRQIIAVSDAIDKNGLIGSEYFASNYDPHIWFHIDYWKQAAQFVINELKRLDSKNAETFEKNGQAYLSKLDALAKEISVTIEALPVEKRILVTAHDAFNYFGKLHNFEVVGLQGLSTATEAGVQDVQKLADFIIEKNVKAIFVESSVPKRTIEALQASVEANGHEVAIGGTLYSDALGNAGTVEGTYIGMYTYNVQTIVNALK
ncbi:periplasmic zinc-binding protein TroA [Kordia sp. SMS9]|uniref:metal ABC transporter solute-binding protein, Zn/Mn family n=1 Tax=Kordia sp. SMS9 TaxID=2282170 RepID=UPI000E0D4378|nr:zinc ABC transporter substrate-binding protein [Kordia sp. SMS9]AXG69176.1 periplasmic zinc-binding protein TroA [Kordia sp. SMS9]